jgi:classical protein kinase C beta type
LPDQPSDLVLTDKKHADRKLNIEVWDYDMTSRNDFIGSMTFSLKDLAAAPGGKYGWTVGLAASFTYCRLSGWFKLLDKKKGDLIHVPVAPGLSDLSAVPDNAPGFGKQLSSAAMLSPASAGDAAPAFAKQTSTSSAVPSGSFAKQPSSTAVTAGHFSAADFKFLKVLGKGSFGKVCCCCCWWWSSVFVSVCPLFLLPIFDVHFAEQLYFLTVHR